jgi:hypothetical protein
MTHLRLLVFSIFAAILFFPLTAHTIGAAGDTAWPAGASLETRLSLTASVNDEGLPTIEGNLTIINSGNAPVTVQKPTNRLALAFLILDSLGNPVTPTFRGKSDPAFETKLLDSRTTITHAFVGLDFVTGSALVGYDLKRGQQYRVIAVYRQAGLNGPGFAAQEASVQIPK